MLNDYQTKERKYEERIEMDDLCSEVGCEHPEDLCDSKIPKNCPLKKHRLEEEIQRWD